MTRLHSKSGRFIALIPDAPAAGFAVVVTVWGVEAFKDRWPCSQLGNGPIRFEFESNGDLCGMSRDVDGPDVLALSEDAQRFGEKCMERRKTAAV